MLNRGRLIFPVYAVIAQLDTVATSVAGGYDNVFREVKLSSTPDGIGEDMRVNKTEIRVPCQIEEKDFFEQLNMVQQGDAPTTRILLTFHLSDLKNLGLWIETDTYGGRPKLNVGDQVIGFIDRYGQQLFKVPTNPGLFITEVMPTGFLTTQNLIVCVVGDRVQGSAVGGAG